jgi:hypothetical protein
MAHFSFIVAGMKDYCSVNCLVLKHMVATLNFPSSVLGFIL